MFVAMMSEEYVVALIVKGNTAPVPPYAVAVGKECGEKPSDTSAQSRHEPISEHKSGYGIGPANAFRAFEFPLQLDVAQPEERRGTGR